MSRWVLVLTSRQISGTMLFALVLQYKNYHDANHVVYFQLAHNSGPPTARQRYAIKMAYRWQAVDCPTMYVIYTRFFRCIL